MNWMPHFSHGYFALAGLLCAAGPLLIHLLNRRRYRILEWAAMDLLRQALRRQQRRIQMRDWILLLLRTAAVLLFGLALAQPFFRGSSAPLDRVSPRHVILLIDNSLSMGYRPVDISLLEQAKQQATNVLENLPAGSQVSVLPTCGNRYPYRGPLRRKIDALERLTSITLAEDSSRKAKVVARVQAALHAADPLPDQVIYFTDLQQADWAEEQIPSAAGSMPLWHIRDLGSNRGENAWVGGVQLQDEVLSLGSSATVWATVHYVGARQRHIQVTLTADGQQVCTRSVTLEPGRTTRRIALECTVPTTALQAGATRFVPLHVALTPDQLPEDDSQTLLVPVVASLPVVFVDQYADDAEDALLGRIGETSPVRHLLNPRTRDEQQHLLEVRHVSIDQVNRSLLAAARLVVVAGVADPQAAAPILREYVEQGGPLVIAAGGDFDPVAWNRSAGATGAGLLPCELRPQPLEYTPPPIPSDSAKPYGLVVESVADEPLLRPAGLSNDELRSLYSEPLFFRAIACIASGDDSGDATPAGDSGSSVESPDWLTWRPPDAIPSAENDVKSASANDLSRARVGATLNDPNTTPLLVHHQIGKGTVVFFASSIRPTWNNLAQTNAVLLWDYLFRNLLQTTLARHNYSPRDQLSLPVPLSQRGQMIRLSRPTSELAGESLDLGFIGRDQLGITIPALWMRGLYRLASEQPLNRPQPFTAEPWEWNLAITGTVDESDLATMSAVEFQTHIADPQWGVRWPEDDLGIPASSSSASTAWWWLALSVLLLLLTEMILLAFHHRSTRTRLITDFQSGMPQT